MSPQHSCEQSPRHGETKVILLYVDVLLIELFARESLCSSYYLSSHFSRERTPSGDD